jgi:hypothetical protein
VRRRWYAQQRLWLGPGRYRGGSGHSAATSHAESYTNSNSFGFCMRTDAIANANCDSNGDDNGYCNPYRDRNGNG